MGGRNLAILAIAIVLGLLAVIVANAWFSGVEERQERIAEEQQLTRIVVATQPLEFGTPLTPENLRLQNFPAASVPAGSFMSMEEAMQGGRVALRPIVVGEPILADKVSGSGGRAVLSALLPDGMRAVSIPVTAVSGVSGFVRPGDIVDIMLTRQIPGLGATPQDQMTDIIMEGVQVLAIDQMATQVEGSENPGVGRTAVVQVDQYGAQKLVLAERLGQLTLALRNVENQEPGPLLTVTSRDLGDPSIYLAGQRTPPPASSPPPVIYAPPGYMTPQQTPARAQPSAPPAPSGPSMSIIRGTESTDYPVGRLGGR